MVGFAPVLFWNALVARYCAVKLATNLPLLRPIACADPASCIFQLLVTGQLHITCNTGEKENSQDLS